MPTIRLWTCAICSLLASAAAAAPSGFVKSMISLDAPPVALAFDTDGVLYALESTFENNQATLRTIYSDGTFGPSLPVVSEDSEIFYIGNMAYDPLEDRLLVTESAFAGRLYAVDQNGVDEAVVLASEIENLASVAVRDTGEIFVTTSATGGGQVLQIDRTTGAKTVVLDGVLELGFGAGLAFDLSGDLIVQDAYFNSSSELRGRLQRIPISDSPAGLEFGDPELLIDNMNSSYSLIIDSEGDIFTTGFGGLFQVAAGVQPVETPFDENPSQFSAAIAFDPGSLPFEGFMGPEAGRLAYTANSFGDTFITMLTAGPGDYNGDGQVDEMDYATWQQEFGSTTELSADGNGDAIVDAADYVIWRKVVDAWAGSFDATQPLNTPEPAAALLCGLGCIAIGIKTRFRTPRRRRA